MENIHPEGSRTARSARWAFRAPMLLSAALICLITGLNITRLLPARSPRDSYEAIEVMEAWRSLHGLPVYELSADGHATHFYGAFVPRFQSEIFRWVGPNNISGRVLTLVSALAAITLATLWTRVKGSGWLLFVIWAALFGLNHRSGQYFVNNRPDMTALLLAMAALFLMGLGAEKRRSGWIAAGTACLILGFFFKQTACIFSAVPLVALALKGRRPARAEVLQALFPMAAVVGVMVYLKFFCPAIHHYMIEVPGSYRIEWLRVVDGLVWRTLLASPLFLILAVEWLVADRGSLREDPRMRWIVAMLAVTIPFCSLAYGKYGGQPNSLLPLLMVMIAFMALRLPTVLARLEGRVASPYARALLGSIAALLLFLSAFPRLNVMSDRPPWDAAYGKVIAAVSKLPGTVICLEDPTIPLYAKAHAGRALAAEFDTAPQNGGWRDGIPTAVIDEVRRADLIVDIRDYWDDRMSQEDIRSLGFELAEEWMPDASPYRLWRRGPADPAPDVSRTAWNGTDDASTRRGRDR